MAESIFEKVKARASVTEVVTHFGGLQFNRQGFASCPFHSEKTPSLSVKEHKGIWHCFGCDTGGSVIDFVAKIKGIAPLDAAIILAEFYGIDKTDHCGNVRGDRKSVPPSPTRLDANLDEPVQISEEQKKRNAAFIRQCSADRSADEYLKGRGLTAETIKRFNLGYSKKHDAAIIPYPNEIYYTMRLLNPSYEQKPHIKPLEKYWGKAPLFNVAALDGEGAVFIVESQICAISIMQAGGTAVGLGGLGYTGLLIREIEKRGGRPKCVFILSLDNDDAGNAKQEQLAAQLKANGVRYIKRRVQGDDIKIKDPNELLQADAAALAANIKAATEEANKVAEIPKTMDKEQAVKALLAKDITDVSEIFKTEYIDALAYAKEHLPAEYSVFKIKVKAAKISVRDLENTVNQYARKSKGKAEVDGLPLDLGRNDLNGAVAPKGWTVSLAEGVRKVVRTRDGEHEIIACPDAVIITAFLFNVDDGKERMEISFFRNGAWKKIIGARMQVSNKNTLMSFADDGLRVNSESARDLIIYLAEYDRCNSEVIKQKKSLSRVGWIGESQFFPFATDEEIVYEENGGAGIFYSLREQGNYAEWKEMMAELRNNKFARFITSASFASPLIVKMGVRPFAIHIWHDSASGKSAALKAAISVWGNPQKVMGTAFTTVVGLEQRAGTLNNLPLGIDEKQAADENKTPLAKLIYMLGEGEGKTRGAKGGGNQETVTWHNIAIITGEEPITSTSSKDGIQTRTLELNGRPVDDMDFAQAVHKISEDNYGYAGAAFMRAICAALKNDHAFLAKKYADTYITLKAKGYRGVHAEFIAAVIVADYLAETLIFGKDAQTAERESFEKGIVIFEHNKEQLHEDNIQSAYDFTVGWIASNEGRFQESGVTTPLYGKKADGGEYKATYYVIPLHLDDALTEAGFNTGKVIRGFMERGFITPYSDANGKRRKKHQVTFNGVRTDMYRFDLVKKDKPPKQTTIAELKPFEDDEEIPF